MGGILSRQPQVEILAGLRKPGTQGWNGAFVAVRSEGKMTVAFFEDNKDFIANDLSDEQLQQTVSQLTEDGWLPMDREDIKRTSGV